MTILAALVATAVLATLAGLGAQSPGLRNVLGTVIPYVAIALFLGGFIYRVIKWALIPVPFRIPTTCGQQKSLSWIRPSRLDNPHTTLGVIGRMALEVLFFRSLFRNTRMEIKPGGNVVHGPNKWLWLAGLVFHWSFLLIFIRHLRFFTEPVPGFVLGLQTVDSFFEIGVPAVYLTSLLLLGALLFLFLRRIVSPQLRYISLANDYFPLSLLLGIGTTGMLMRHFAKTDIESVKSLAIGILSFKPAVPDDVDPLFFMHFFLVCVLFAVFPYSKLMHMAGVFMSPTRNLANTNRMRRHVNPWNYPVKIRTYEEYEDEFRDKMKAAGIPVEKE
ncbi:sulfate reduction electron transfer complex DsrMKJOP subunit DsrM [bacterium]|nr:sulfate reduction electron transfer complex DsrMKJOP subunit DsrM [bacterium]MBU1073875.1 sulfate reduction electron transfer complex DsrMKJOP subunit DsrM [bacterium]MBU1676793.1 sulfate reduction electron transfer complex DsrMKJOP subunit DsrM [bacterium]